MDAGAFGELQGTGSHFDIFGGGASQRSDARLPYGLGNRSDGCKVALRGHGEAGLDDVYPQVLQGVRHGQLFLRRHAATGRLLAVAQRGVEEDNAVVRHEAASGGLFMPALSVFSIPPYKTKL